MHPVVLHQQQTGSPGIRIRCQKVGRWLPDGADGALLVKFLSTMNDSAGERRLAWQTTAPRVRHRLSSQWQTSPPVESPVALGFHYQFLALGGVPTYAIDG